MELEKIFDRALAHVFSKRKFFFVFSVLVLCGFFTVICKTLALGAGHWVSVSLTFLPIFLCTGFLLSAGVVLTRAYHNELKKHPYSIVKILQESWQMLLNICYISLPLVLAYLLLWMFMGAFYLLKELPLLGNIIGALLAFAPFMLMLVAILLGIFSIVVLFFATPEAALKTGVKLELIPSIWKRLKVRVLSNAAFLVLGMLPAGVCIALLYVAAYLTGENFFGNVKFVSKLFHHFFLMVPFCALLAPSVIFFFNFAAESFILYRKKEKDCQV